MGQAEPELIVAVGDIHGRLDLASAALEVMQERLTGRAYRLVFLGDYVDRGPDSRGVVELMMRLQERDGAVCLKGNHEDLMVRALSGGAVEDIARWLAIG